MRKKVLEASQQVIDTIKKANQLVNSGTISDQAPKSNILQTQMNGSLTGAQKLVPAKVKEGNGISGYLCDIYGNGLSEPPTDTGTIFLANGASSIFVLPAGTILFVQRYPIVVHGGVN